MELEDIERSKIDSIMSRICILMNKFDNFVYKIIEAIYFRYPDDFKEFIENHREELNE